MMNNKESDDVIHNNDKVVIEVGSVIAEYILFCNFRYR